MLDYVINYTEAVNKHYSFRYVLRRRLSGLSISVREELYKRKEVLLLATRNRPEFDKDIRPINRRTDNLSLETLPTFRTETGRLYNLSLYFLTKSSRVAKLYYSL